MADEKPDQNTTPDDRPEKPKSRRRFIVIGVIAPLVVGALLFWWHSTYYEDTDDAQVNGHLIQISSRIAGQVIKVDVDENKEVKKGDVLYVLEQPPFQAEVDAAKASVEQFEAQHENAQLTLRRAQALLSTPAGQRSPPNVALPRNSPAP